MKIANRSFENVSQFKFLVMTVTNQNLIQEEIKRRLNSGNAYCHSVQNLLSSRLLLKNVKMRIYKTIILLVILYGCETWSLALREEHRLRVLRRIFGPKRDEVTGEWRKLHIEELHYLYSSPSIIRIIKARRMRWAGHVVRMGENRNAYRLLVGKPEGRRPLGRSRRRWLDNIRTPVTRIWKFENILMTSLWNSDLLSSAKCQTGSVVLKSELAVPVPVCGVTSREKNNVQNVLGL
jgi:hypothetical protein